MLDRLTPHIPTATEIAALVQALPIERGAALIEQYARTVASGAAIEAAQQAYDRCLSAMETPLARREPTNA